MESLTQVRNRNLSNYQIVVFAVLKSLPLAVSYGSRSIITLAHHFLVVILTTLIIIVTTLSSLTLAHAEVDASNIFLSFDSHTQHNDIQSDEIHKIIHSDGFIPLEGSHTEEKNTPWVKISWNKDQITDEKYLINDFPTQKIETYYLIKDEQVLTSHTIGNSKPFDVRPIRHFKFVANISDVDYVLLKVCCQNMVPVFFRLLDDTELNEDYYHTLIKYAIVYSLICLMILYNFFIFLYLKEKQYLYYCLYLSSVFFGLLAVSGLGKQFLWANMTNLEFLYVSSPIFISVTSMMFIIHFLDGKYITKTTFKLVDYSIKFQWCFITLLFSIRWLMPEHFFMLIPDFSLTLIVVLAVIINDYVIIRNWLAGDKSAKVMFFSYTLINVGIILVILRFEGLIANTPWSEFYVDIAAVIEALVLSFALAQKIQKLKDDKISAEEKQLTLQKQFSRQLLQVQEEEKRQLGSALHDNFTHQLLILKNSINKKIGFSAPESQQVDTILKEMRDLSHVVHPYVLEKLGLDEALYDMIDKLSESNGLEIAMVTDQLSLSKDQSLTVYRIIQELLNNIIKHAEASECVIAIRKKPATTKHSTPTIVEITVKDDGIGFATNAKKGLGLNTINERCQMLSGELSINTNTDSTNTNNLKTKIGSEIKICFPYQPEPTLMTDTTATNINRIEYN